IAVVLWITLSITDMRLSALLRNPSSPHFCNGGTQDGVARDEIPPFDKGGVGGISSQRYVAFFHHLYPLIRNFPCCSLSVLASRLAHAYTALMCGVGVLVSAPSSITEPTSA